MGTISGGGGGGGSGTVTSVDMSVPGVLYSLTGNPITAAGTLALALKTQAANSVLSGPSTGADATPTMRALVAGDVPALDAAKITSGTLALARLAGITTSQLDAAAGITSGQIAGLAASKLTGTNTLPDGVLSTNVPLLGGANVFSAAQTIAASVAGPLAQINNSSTTGAGLVIGSTTVASAGAGLIAPALALTQTVPATNRYGLLSIGGAPWDGTTTGKFAGSSSGQVLALNAASGFGGYLFDMQVAGVSFVRYDMGAAGGLRVVQCNNSGIISATLGSPNGNFFGAAIRNNTGNLTLGSTSDSAAKLINAAVALTRAAKTGAYTMTSADAVILADATTAAFSVTLPAAGAVAGQLVHVKKTDSSANAVTVSRAGSDTIEGATTVSLAAQYSSLTALSDGTATFYKVATN